MCKHNYYWFGTQLAMMTITNGTSVTTLKFYYDDNGIPLMFDYNGTLYMYITNLQGDVLGLADESGMGAYYNYDAWGNIVEMDSATTPYYNAMNANPLRYRGYIYDTETGFYYLRSRYYDPSVCRFINEDVVIAGMGSYKGYNLYQYCFNNPINCIDNTGFWTISLSLGLDITAFFFGASVSIGFALDDDGNFAVQLSYSAPNLLTDDETSNIGLLDAGIGVSAQYTDDDTVYDLEGPSSYAGFSVGDGWYAGVDAVYSGCTVDNEESMNELPNGIQVTVGAGLGFDAHFRQTQTRNIGVLKLW